MILTGNETLSVVGVLRDGSPASIEEVTTTGAIAALANASQPYAVTIVASGTSYTAQPTDEVIAFASASTSAKSLLLPAPTVTGKPYIIVDEIGTAATYNITITTQSATINNQTSFVMNFNNQAITLIADGATNWMVT